MINFARSLAFSLLKRPISALPTKNTPKLIEPMIMKGFHKDKDLAKRAFFLFNGDTTESRKNFDAELIDRAVEFGYLDWPRKIIEDIRGKDVFDVGCGTGIHAIGFIVAGARSYTGVDPKVNLGNDNSKNLRERRWEGFGFTPAEIMERMPRIRLISGTTSDLPAEPAFDVAVLHNVTEHLIQLEDVFDDIKQRLREHGVVVYNHHNFFSWNGHHLAPKFVSEIDESDSEQLKYVDWAHLEFKPPEGHYFTYGLNKIRMHELHDLTSKYFNIAEWKVISSKENQGSGRLTAEICAKHPDVTELELRTQNVLCRAVQKSADASKHTKFSSAKRDIAREGDFLKFYFQCEPYTMTTPERLFALFKAIEYVVREDVPGDIVECGVWRGGSMMMAAMALNHFGDRRDRNIWLFDTYEGMAPPTEADYKFEDETPAKVKWEASTDSGATNWNFSPLKDVRLNMRTTGWPEERMCFVQGRVEETLPTAKIGEIALLRLDTDFYTSTFAELEHLYPKLASRGVLVLDDYGTWAGSKKAADEYLATLSERPLLSRIDAAARLAIKP